MAIRKPLVLLLNNSVGELPGGDGLLSYLDPDTATLPELINALLTAGVMEPDVLAMPANLVAPVISGSATTPTTLSCTTGTWSGFPTSYSYQWRLDGVDLSGETASTIEVIEGEVGTYDCGVDATNAIDTSARTYSNTIAVSDVIVPPSGGLAVFADPNAYMVLSEGNTRATYTGDDSTTGNNLSNVAILEPTYFEIRLHHGGAGGYIGAQLWAEPETTLIDYAVLGLWYGKAGVYIGIDGQYSVALFGFYGMTEEISETIALWDGGVPTTADIYMAVNGRNVWVSSNADEDWYGGGNPETNTTPSFVIPGTEPIKFGAGGVGDTNNALILDPTDYTRSSTPTGFRLGVAGPPKFIGYNGLPDDTTALSDDRVWAYKVVLTEDAILDEFFFYKATGAGGPELKGLVFSDNAGEPDVLVASTDMVSCPAGPQWVEIPITGTLSAGTYWIACVTGGIYTPVGATSTRPGEEIKRAEAYPYPGWNTDWPGTAGTVTPRSLCVYVTYH